MQAATIAAYGLVGACACGAGLVCILWCGSQQNVLDQSMCVSAIGVTYSIIGGVHNFLDGVFNSPSFMEGVCTDDLPYLMSATQRGFVLRIEQTCDTWRCET